MASTQKPEKRSIRAEIPEEVATALEALARDNDRTFAAEIRRALALYVTTAGSQVAA